MMESTVSIGRAAKLLGVSVVTIRRWCASGKMKEKYRTAGNHRRFCLSLLRRLRGESEGGLVVGYASVSSHDQKKDLSTQAERLRARGCDTVITDLGSGLNCRKAGLKKLIKTILSGEMSRLVITHKDRLLRFGHELIFYLCRCFGVLVTVTEESEKIAFEEELTRDVITLMTVFSARLYGRRSHQNRNKVLTDQPIAV